MFNISIIGQRLTDGVPFCAIIHEDDLHCAICAFADEFPNSQILSLHACNIQGGKHEVRHHVMVKDHG